MPSTNARARLAQYAKSTLIVGVSGALSVAATDYALDRFTALHGWQRGAAQAAGHIALGALVASIGMPEVGAGIAVGGVVSGTEDVIAFYRATEAERAAMKSAAERRLAAYRAGSSSSTPTTTTPGTSTGLLPDGMHSPPFGQPTGRARVASAVG